MSFSQQALLFVQLGKNGNNTLLWNTQYFDRWRGPLLGTKKVCWNLVALESICRKKLSLYLPVPFTIHQNLIISHRGLNQTILYINCEADPFISETINRKKMDPTFSIQRLEKLLSQFYEISTSFCEAVQTAIQDSPGDPIDLKKLLSPFNVGQCLNVFCLY